MLGKGAIILALDVGEIGMFGGSVPSPVGEEGV